MRIGIPDVGAQPASPLEERGLVVNHSSLGDASMPEWPQAVSPQAQHALARAVVLAAVGHTGLDDTPVIAALRAPSAKKLEMLAVDELDTAAFVAQGRLDEGTGTDADYVQVAAHARAATAAVAAFAEDPAEAAETHTTRHCTPPTKTWMSCAARSTTSLTPAPRRAR